MDDELLIKTAKEVVKAAGKNRFSHMDVRRQLAKNNNVEYVKLTHKKDGSKYNVLREIKRLTQGKNAPFVEGRSMNTFRIAKQTKGKGLEFKRVDAESTDILYDGESIGEITYGEGDFIHGSSRQRKKVYDVNVDTKNTHAPSEFGKIADAKKWVKSNLKKILADLVE
jgi:hypothetical protein